MGTNRCYICDEELVSHKKKFQICSNAVPHSGKSFSDTMAEILGVEYVSIISPNDYICKRCTSHLKFYDETESQLQIVKDAILFFILKKQKMLPADYKFKAIGVTEEYFQQQEAQEPNNSKYPPIFESEKFKTKKLYRCYKCSFASQVLYITNAHVLEHVEKKENKKRLGMDANMTNLCIAEEEASSTPTEELQENKTMQNDDQEKYLIDLYCGQMDSSSVEFHDNEKNENTVEDNPSATTRVIPEKTIREQNDQQEIIVTDLITSQMDNISSVELYENRRNKNKYANIPSATTKDLLEKVQVHNNTQVKSSIALKSSQIDKINAIEHHSYIRRKNKIDDIPSATTKGLLEKKIHVQSEKQVKASIDLGNSQMDISAVELHGYKRKNKNKVQDIPSATTKDMLEKNIQVQNDQQEVCFIDLTSSEMDISSKQFYDYNRNKNNDEDIPSATTEDLLEKKIQMGNDKRVKASLDLKNGQMDISAVELHGYKRTNKNKVQIIPLPTTKYTLEKKIQDVQNDQQEIIVMDLISSQIDNISSVELHEYKRNKNKNEDISSATTKDLLEQKIHLQSDSKVKSSVALKRSQMDIGAVELPGYKRRNNNENEDIPSATTKDLLEKKIRVGKDQRVISSIDLKNNQMDISAVELSGYKRRNKNKKEYIPSTTTKDLLGKKIEVHNNTRVKSSIALKSSQMDEINLVDLKGYIRGKNKNEDIPSATNNDMLEKKIQVENDHQVVCFIDLTSSEMDISSKEFYDYNRNKNKLEDIPSATTKDSLEKQVHVQSDSKVKSSVALKSSKMDFGAVELQSFRRNENKNDITSVTTKDLQEKKIKVRNDKRVKDSMDLKNSPMDISALEFCGYKRKNKNKNDDIPSATIKDFLKKNVQVQSDIHKKSSIALKSSQVDIGAAELHGNKRNKNKVKNVCSASTKDLLEKNHQPEVCFIDLTSSEVDISSQEYNDYNRNKNNDEIPSRTTKEFFKKKIHVQSDTHKKSSIALKSSQVDIGSVELHGYKRRNKNKNEDIPSAVTKDLLEKKIQVGNDKLLEASIDLKNGQMDISAVELHGYKRKKKNKNEDIPSATIKDFQKKKVRVQSDTHKKSSIALKSSQVDIGAVELHGYKKRNTNKNEDIPAAATKDLVEKKMQVENNKRLKTSIDLKNGQMDISAVELHGYKRKNKNKCQDILSTTTNDMLKRKIQVPNDQQQVSFIDLISSEMDISSKEINDYKSNKNTVRNVCSATTQDLLGKKIQVHNDKLIKSIHLKRSHMDICSEELHDYKRIKKVDDIPSATSNDLLEKKIQVKNNVQSPIDLKSNQMDINSVQLHDCKKNVSKAEDTNAELIKMQNNKQEKSTDLEVCQNDGVNSLLLLLNNISPVENIFADQQQYDYSLFQDEHNMSEIDIDALLEPFCDESFLL